MFQNKYRTIAEHLLARRLCKADGFTIEEIKQYSELRLPQALIDYYSVAGRLSINVAHNRLLLPSEVHLDANESMIVIMDENQSVCSWGIRIDDTDEIDPVVFQGQPNQSEWYSEECTLSEWLEICLYLQCCWGGLQFSCDHTDPSALITEIRKNWKQVVEHNGLLIWENNGVLISDLGQPWYNGSANTHEGFIKLQELGFEPRHCD